MNSRLDEIQAAVLRVKLKYLDSDNTKRRKLADLYTQGLSDLPIQVPIVREGSKSVFHLYVIQVENRQGLLSHLKEKGILAGIHYPTPVHLQPAYKGRIKGMENRTSKRKCICKDNFITSLSRIIQKKCRENN